MNRRSFLGAAGFGAAASMKGYDARATGGQNPNLSGPPYDGAPAGHHIPEPGMPSRSNMIWIVADQIRAQALSMNGNPNARTPSLSRAEVNGVLTSRYPHQC